MTGLAVISQVLIHNSCNVLFEERDKRLPYVTKRFQPLMCWAIHTYLQCNSENFKKHKISLPKGIAKYVSNSTHAVVI